MDDKLSLKGAWSGHVNGEPFKFWWTATISPERLKNC